jgi:solute:Na+ symporter, SSS family
LALSYFGTDQSQVGRYLTAKDDKESKLGLLMNGLVKVPMQFFILLLGALLFVFYQFKPMPIYFDKAAEIKVYQSAYKDSMQNVQNAYYLVQTKKQDISIDYIKTNNANSKFKIQNLKQQEDSLRTLASHYAKASNASPDGKDTNYIFLRFVVDNLPKGLVGLLIAIIFLSAWGSIAASLNSLAGCTMIDFHLRFTKQKATEKKEYNLSKFYTFVWGVFCIVVAELATGMGSLIEAVNVLGSLFYGVILGIFLVAFYCKKVKANAVFIAAIITELIVIALFTLDKMNIIGLGFLWLNVVGALLVVMFSLLLQRIFKNAYLHRPK